MTKPRYYVDKTRIKDREDPQCQMTTDIECIILNKQDHTIKDLTQQNHELLEKNVELENKLDYLEEAINTVESEYTTKQHIQGKRIESMHKKNCITEIWKQYELIELREETL